MNRTDLVQSKVTGPVHPGLFQTLHNIVSSAGEPAQAISRSWHLTAKRIVTHDEISHAGHPVLVRIATASASRCLLECGDFKE